ncbi:MAG: asparagine synthase (glutamine-hydrolyzing) [Actinomycetota bacterium]|nr:asparagine synthase (glutamine-hydrolyzing) [Actinomycetota bacterium]
MCAAMRHRGPDSRGAFAEEDVALGVQRLKVIDLESGDQPIYNETGDVVVVMNGEIYNFRELRAELERRGHRFATQTDTEVIVHLYEEYGTACIGHLRGMFGLALWDRSRRKLLLARDRVGKKPLFYCLRGQHLSFASEVKGLLQDSSIPRTVNHQAIESYLHLSYVPDPESAFLALRRIPPGHIMTWSDGHVEVRRYWRLDYEPDLPGAEEELRERLRDSLLEAVRIRLRSDVPLGAFLSGGVDSSAVVAAMAMEGSGRVKTFSIGFDVEGFNETFHAREVARHLDTDHHELILDPSSVEPIANLATSFGEPFADHSAIPSLYLAEMTKRKVTVALNGDGGDESFAGYRRYVPSMLGQRLGLVPRRVWQVAAGPTAFLGDRGQRGGRRDRMHRFVRASPLPPAERHAAWLACFAEDERRTLYTPEFMELSSGPACPPAITTAYADSDGRELLDRLLYVDLQTYLPGDLLVKMDIATMAHSLEARSPLLDHRFLELAARLPASTKLTWGGTTKRLFKEAVAPWLPSEIITRPKMGFSIPLASWLRGKLRALPEDVLLDSVALGRGYFRPEVVRRLIDDHMSSKRDNADRLWALIQLELWHRSFVDAAPTANLQP